MKTCDTIYKIWKCSRRTRIKRDLDSSTRMLSSRPWSSLGQANEFSDADRENVIRCYAEEAGVEGQYTSTHGKNVYG